MTFVSLMGIFQSVGDYLTLNGLVTEADILYVRSERDFSLRARTADFYFMAVLYAVTTPREAQARIYVTRLQERVSLDYNPWQHQGHLRDLASELSSPQKDLRKLQKAVRRFDEVHPLFLFDDFVADYLPLYSDGVIQFPCSNRRATP